VVALALALLAYGSFPEGKGHAVAWNDLSARVGPLTIDASQRRLFRKRVKLAKFLREAQGTRPVPEIDFSRRQLLLVSPGPRSSTGYSVQVLSVRERGGKINVRVREASPRLGEPVRPRVTHPYRLISLPAGEDVFVDWVGR
jgi:hypothetical protein